MIYIMIARRRGLCYLRLKRDGNYSVLLVIRLFACKRKKKKKRYITCYVKEAKRNPQAFFLYYYFFLLIKVFTFAPQWMEVEEVPKADQRLLVSSSPIQTSSSPSSSPSVSPCLVPWPLLGSSFAVQIQMQMSL